MDKTLASCRKIQGYIQEELKQKDDEYAAYVCASYKRILIKALARVDQIAADPEMVHEMRLFFVFEFFV